MVILKETEIIDKTVLEVARKMIVAARTAPKTRGRNTIETLIIKGKDKKPLADQMKQLGKDSGAHYFGRDGENILRRVIDSFGFSARAYHRILKVSRTIADLEGADDICARHISEAVQYRTLDRNIWMK